ncbi:MULTISPECIES: hypothetical protein [unclassified Neorhizobium]|uniref:hypothetical protein n=1 Tax=unclassified Neorhizobium TaxID=2629175 RepID=UPI001FF39ED3|nr:MULTISPECIES: hypothetical protein [unclassified Neorhizobium]MCJ9669007.1 hypothetical protein [Neorhizobium sp. SHOUNA12B]MCJ9744961.1 hypothetical protein [Neorhizobium sp. SHOUNA12A]
MTLSDDACRQGALRFVDDRGAIIRGSAADAIPRLVDLEAITTIARAYEQGKEICAGNRHCRENPGDGGSGAGE